MQYDIKDFGAKNDRVTNNAPLIQQAIDTCSAQGGGIVVVGGGGAYLTGTLRLKSFVTLRVEPGTTLLGSPLVDDYATDTYKLLYKDSDCLDRCLIYGEDLESVAIEGEGVIDGNGHQENFPHERPMLLRLLRCRKMRLNNISLSNPAAWTTAFLYCDDISVVGITISSRVNLNGDGLDFDGCTNVRVTNCNFDNSDDSICLQASRPEYPCRDIVISNCIFSTQWAGLRIGLLSRGDIHSVAVSNCTFHDIDDAGIKIQQCEGGEMRNMVFSNLVMRNVPRPIFMTFSQQRASREVPEGVLEPLATMHHFSFCNLMIDNRVGDVHSAIFISGFPGYSISDITLRDVHFVVAGGGTRAMAEQREVNEFTLDVVKDHWPEFYCLKQLPSYGLYLRHVDGVSLENVVIESIESDCRTPVFLDDVCGLRVGSVIANGAVIELDNDS